MSGIQFTVTLDEAEVDAIIQRATEEVRALAAKSLTPQLIAPMVKDRIVPHAIGQPVKPQAQERLTWDDPITWDDLLSRVKSLSVPTAALLAQKASIIGYARNSHLHLKTAKPFAEQFARQQSKANVLIQCAREILGDKTEVTIFTQDDTRYDLEYKDIRVLTIPSQVVATPDASFSRLIDLINSGRWTYEGNKGRSQPAAFLTVADSIICYEMPRYPGILFLSHLAEPVRNILGETPNYTLRKWLQSGLLMLCDKHPSDKKHRFSQNISVLGENATLARISIAKLDELGLKVKLFKFPGETV
jgi:hypothetical protein